MINRPKEVYQYPWPAALGPSAVFVCGVAWPCYGVLWFATFCMVSMILSNNVLYGKVGTRGYGSVL